MNNTVTVNINCDGSVPVIVNINCNKNSNNDNNPNHTKQIAISQNSNNDNNPNHTKQIAISQNNNNTIDAAIDEINNEWMKNSNNSAINNEIKSSLTKKDNNSSKQYAYDDYVIKPIDTANITPIMASDCDDDYSDTVDDDYSDTVDDDYSDTVDDDTSPDYKESNKDYSSTDGYSSSESAITRKNKNVSKSDSITPVIKKKYISKKAPASKSSSDSITPVIKKKYISKKAPASKSSSDSDSHVQSRAISLPKFCFDNLNNGTIRANIRDYHKIQGLIANWKNSNNNINEEFYIEGYNKYIANLPCKQILVDYTNFWYNNSAIKDSCALIEQKRNDIANKKGYIMKTFLTKCIHRDIKTFLRDHLIMKLYTKHGMISQKIIELMYDTHYPTEKYHVDYIKHAVSKVSPGVFTHEQIKSITSLIKKYAEDDITLIEYESTTLPIVNISVPLFDNYFNNKQLLQENITETHERNLYNGKTTSFIEDLFVNVYYKKYKKDSSMNEFISILKEFSIKFSDDTIFDQIVGNAKSYVINRKFEESFEQFQKEYFGKFFRFNLIDKYIGEPEIEITTNNFKEVVIPPQIADVEEIPNVYETEWNNAEIIEDTKRRANDILQNVDAKIANADAELEKYDNFVKKIKDEEALQEIRHRIDTVVAPVNASLKDAYDDLAKYDAFIEHMKNQNIDAGDDDAGDNTPSSTNNDDDAGDDDAGDNTPSSTNNDADAGDDDAGDNTPSSTNNDADANDTDDGLIIITKKNRLSKY